MNKLSVVSMVCVLASLAGCGGGGGSDNGGGGSGSTPAPTVSLNADATVAQVGDKATLTWSSTGTSSCNASGVWSGARPTGGNEIVTLSTAGENVFTLTCSGPGGSANGSARLTVNAAAVTLTPAAKKILLGQSTKLTWSAASATDCTASGAWSGAKPVSGEEIVTPAAAGDSQYILTCTLSSGKASATATVTTATHQLAYVTNDGDAVSVFDIDNATGGLSEIMGSPVRAGGHPRSVALDQQHGFAYVANRTTNDISIYSVGSAGGLTPTAGGPFASRGMPAAIAIDPAGKAAYVATNDGLVTYAIDASVGSLTAVGSLVTGSEAVAVHPSGKFVYAASTAGISAYVIDSTSRALTAISGSPFAAGSVPVSIAIDAAGKFAYVPNGTSGNISAYVIDATTGALTAIPGSPFAAGTGPLQVVVDPSAKFAYVANVGGVSSGSLRAYSIDSGTGALTQLADLPLPANIRPLTLAIDSVGKYVYVGTIGNNGSSPKQIRGYSVGTNGLLTELAGSPFATASDPTAIVVTY